MTCVATTWNGMEQQRDEWSSKGNARKRMNLQRHGGARLRRAMELHGTDMSGTAKAMDARRSFDKQRQCKAKRGNGKE